MIGNSLQCIGHCKANYNIETQ